MSILRDDERIEALGSGLRVLISPDHGFGTDALLLAEFADPKRNAPCLDLGTGCGIIPLLWKRNGVSADICGLELQEKGYDQFCRSIELCKEQGISMDNVHALCGDLRDLSPLDLPLGKFKTVTMNPPYKPVDTGILSETTAEQIARHETTCTMDDAAAAAERLLNFGGNFVVCHRPERLPDVLEAFRAHSIEPKRLRFVQKNAGSAPWLFLLEGRKGGTGTPIGNLSDFSPRAIEALESADFIAAEDTRVTLKLLNHFDIKTPMVSYHEHNKNQKGPELLARILKGENCALVTDAGMPAISDPGQDLVDLCLEHGVPVHSVPGPTAFATALALSGMDSRRFTFEGFLEVDKKKRRAQLEFLKTQPCTLILYEAPHKLSATLRDLLEALGDRKLCICREITKVHEEVLRMTLSEAVEAYPHNDLKGELVLILEGASKEEKVFTLEDAVAMAQDLIASGASKNDAAKETAKTTGLKKGDIYRELF